LTATAPAGGPVHRRAPGEGPSRTGATWRSLAACRGLGPEDFYSPPYSRALARCRHCPVWEPCLFLALASEGAGYRYGAWGGATPTQRDAAYAYLAARHLDPAVLLAEDEAWWSSRLAGQGNDRALPQAAA
jgi:hypothetical protein